LDKISKKYDKQTSTGSGGAHSSIRKENWATATDQLGDAFSSISIDDWSLVRPYNPNPNPNPNHNPDPNPNHDDWCLLRPCCLGIAWSLEAFWMEV
jgi:hypothetical protein